MLASVMYDHSMMDQLDKTEAVRKISRESIHSGHFMVSDFEAEAQDDEGFEVPEQTDNTQAVEEIQGIRAIKLGHVITYDKPTNKTEKTTVSIDASLTKLFTTMHIAYRQNICSPKWNPFKGLKLRWKDKIRLNNVIWRCWHMQFIKRKKMAVCQFALDVDMHNKPETTILEGKYWKRRMEAVTAEYKKWRLYYKNRRSGIFMNCDIQDMSFLGLEEMDWAKSIIGGQSADDLGEIDFMDVLFANPQQFHFPNPREIARGTENSDLLQPGLIQLQPDFNDYVVDFHEMLARDLPTVPEEDFFPDVETAGLPPSPSSPISTPQPQIEYTARLTASEVYTNQTTTSLDTIPQQTTSLSDFSGDGFILPRQSPPAQMLNQIFNSQDVDLPKSPMPLSPPDISQRQERLRSIGRSRSHQEINLQRGMSPHRQDSSQFAVPKPYGRRRSHSGTPSPLQQATNQVLNTLSVPSLPAAVSSGLGVSPVGQSVPQTTVFTFGSTTSPVDTSNQQDFQQSALLAHLLTTEAASSHTVPTAGGDELKLSVYLPPQTSAESYNTSNNSTCSVSGVTNVSRVQMGFNSSQPLLFPNVTLSAVTPSSFKGLNYSTSGTAFGAINLKTSPPHSEASPPLLPIPSPPIKPFRPKNEVERVQYKEHRRKCHITAEQKRRCNIKYNFDTLHSLIPSVSQNSQSKVSKATMLHKGAEYIQQLKQERQHLKEKAEILKSEIDVLGGDITAAQALLPANGAPLTHTRHNKLKEKFEDYVKDRTLSNWRFYIFSLIAEPLLESFTSSVSTANVDDLCRTSMGWLDQHCSLNVLRPIVSNSMRRLSTATNILTSPETLPEEAINFITKQEMHSRGNTSGSRVNSYDR